MPLHHVGLTVSDLDVAIAFYQAALGCRVKERSQSAGPELEMLTGVPSASVLTADLDVPGGGWLELIQYAEPRGAPSMQERSAPGHTHIAFVVDDVDAAHARLVALGAAPTSKPVQIVEPGSVWDGARALYACDPDGRTIECVQLR